MSNPTLNADGDVAFMSLLSGDGIGARNGRVLFATHNGTLYPVVRTLTQFDVDPGIGVDLRVIDTIGFSPGVNGDDRSGGFNDDGVLAFRLTFTDGSAGVFTAIVPEPSGLALFAGATIATVRRRRRSFRHND